MSKRVIAALVLIAALAVVLIMTKGTVDVNLLGYQLKKAVASLVYLGFIACGVIIGVLLK
jgi:hypothetical protein